MNKIILYIIISFFFFACIRIDLGRDDTQKEEYKGIITKILQDENNHEHWNFIIRANIKFQKDVQVWPKSWEFAEIGDSIIKQKNSLDITIKKKNGISKVFKYK